MIHYVFLLALLLALPSCASQGEPRIRPLTMPKAHTPGQPFEVAVFHGCYDGDTCTVSLSDLPPVFGDHITVRLAGIDTPEIKGTCDEEKQLARQAQALTQRLMKEATRIELREPKRDKYFRILARVVVEDQARPGETIEVAQELVKAGLARPYDGGKKQRWCPE